MSDSLRERLQAALGTAYELERELPGGGMSRVFVARDTMLGRQVVLPPELAAGVNRERFEREIQLAAQLQHPHVVPLLSAGEVPAESSRGLPSPFYTMPFIEGESLRAQLERRGPLPVREVVRILQDVLEALSYAHMRGVVHRDIKPANILMQGSHALVTDFGVAKALNAALPHSGSTGTGMAIGTPAYMAPEQLAADPKGDHRMDLYALGLVGYEMLSGRSPFSESSPQATMAAQLTRVPARISSLRPDVPRELEALLDRCLAKAAELRPAHAADALSQLERVPIAAGGDSTVRLAAPPAAARPPLRSWAWAAGALVAAGFAVFAFTRSGNNPAVAPQSDVTTSDTAPSITVSTSSPSAARTLTREDSLLIAAKMIERELTLRQAAPQSNADSIRKAIRKELADSIARAQAPSQLPGQAVLRSFVYDSMARRFERLSDSLRGLPSGSRIVVRQPDGRIDTMVTQGLLIGPPGVPPAAGLAVSPLRPVPPGMRRIVLMPFPARRGGAETGRTSQLVLPIRDSVEAAFRRTGRYDVVGADALGAAALTRNVRPNRRGRSGMLAELGAVAMLRGNLELQGDQLVVRVDVEDTLPGPQYLVSLPVPVDAPFPALSRFLDQVVRAIDKID